MIRLSKQSDYGIVLLSTMAAGDRGRYSVGDLAKATLLPLPMVAKTMKLLARSGLLTSQRGAKGGYELSRPPAEISVAQIIAALEGPIAITECVEETTEECSYEASCRVRSNWQRINTAVREALEGISLAEMVHSVGDGALSNFTEGLVALGHRHG